MNNKTGAPVALYRNMGSAPPPRKTYCTVWALFPLSGGVMDDLLIAVFPIFCIVIGSAYLLAVPCLGRWLAKQKGYSGGAWFALCFFFGIFALIALSGAPIKNLDGDITGETPKKLWFCKMCGQENLESASSCRRCGATKT